MSDDNSNDVVVMEMEINDEDSQSSDQFESRPLIQLFQRLINNDNKQNTVLTNAQIILILHKEFKINITTLHDLEVDIYLNVVKKFLKDWPLWDEFDRGINCLQKEQALTSIKETLEDKYVNLKEYLQIHLDAAKPLAQEALRKAIDLKNDDPVDTNDVILEVYCTKRQFNELVYSQPDPELENNIFHLSNNIPMTIPTITLPIGAIMNWCGIKVTVDLKFMSFTRSTMHEIKHTLVNRFNGPRNLKRTLNQNIQIKHGRRSQTLSRDKQFINPLLDIILKQNYGDYKTSILLQVIIKTIKNDVEMFEGDIKVPGTYRQHSSKYPYYRKLYKKAENAAESLENTYDLYIEETLAPMHVLHFARIKGSLVHVPTNVSWLKIECEECKTQFTGIDIYTALKVHYEMYHGHEPDWVCTNCEKSFSMVHLAEHNWHHDCDDD